MKKTFLIFALCFLLSSFGNIFAQDNVANLYLFWREGCPHCEKERAFLPKLQEKYGDKLVIQQFEIWNNKKNLNILQEVTKNFDTPVNGVPLTLIGDEKIVGYGEDSNTGQQIDDAIRYCIENVCNDLVRPVLAKQKAEPEVKKLVTNSLDPSTQVAVPFF